MAYPAVNSLIQTLELFQSSYPNLIHGQTAEIVDSLRASAEYFQYILEKASHQKHEFEIIKDFEGEMKTAVQHAEDLLESNISEIMKEQYKNHQEEKNNGAKWTIQDEARVLLRDLPQAMNKIDAIRKDLAQVMESSTSPSVNASGNAAADDNIFKPVDSSSLKHASTTLVQATTVGLDHALMNITDQLLGSSSERKVIPIWGMGGSGKSTLARKAHDGPSIISRFDIQVWVTISQEYHLREVLLNLVHSITGNEFPEMSDDQLMDKSYKALKGRRYLIVIDDVWNTDIWDLMARTLPEDRNGSRIILTTRLKDVAEYVNSDIPPHEMKTLSLDDSWKLLYNRLFGAAHDNCPSDLEEIGKQIVGKCQGLPLAILVVAGHLSKVPMTEESWETVAKNVSKVITSYPDKCLAVLAMSYHHLPIHLKPCFLHLGIFPEDCEIIIARLIRLWVSEGFLKCDRLKSPEEVAEDCLEDLVSRNLVMVKRRKFDGRMKSCGMHDLLRDLSVHEAKQEKFFDFSATNHETHRFSSHTRIYVEEFEKSSQVMRSLYLFKHHLPTSKTWKFQVLRVLALPMFYPPSIPISIYSPILRYAEIMDIISFIKLFHYMSNLRTIACLIVGQPEVLLLPSKIWNMKLLRHLRFNGQTIYLPNPQDVENSKSDLGLQHLQELDSLCFLCCTKEVLSCLTNLKKLTISGYTRSGTCINYKVIEETSWSLLNLVYLKKLESLSLYFNAKLELSSSLGESISFPISLKKLSLIRTRLPWDDMAILAKYLPNLEVLKLSWNAFIGEVWELNDEDQFMQLKLLLLDRTQPYRWEANNSSVNFPNLQCLVLSEIGVQLKGIPLSFADICSLESIELYQCYGPHLMESVTEIQEEVASVAGCLHVRIYEDTYKNVKRGV